MQVRTEGSILELERHEWVIVLLPAMSFWALPLPSVAHTVQKS
jgi:hypothetical protein